MADRLLLKDVLQKCGANAAELKVAASLLSKSGKPAVNVGDLGDDETSARESAGLISDRKSVVEALMDAWKKDKEKETPGGAPPTKPTKTPSTKTENPSPTVLAADDTPPAFGADLTSYPLVKFPDSGESTAIFKLPEDLTTTVPSNGEITRPGSLKWSDWAKIASNCNLTRATKLTPTGRKDAVNKAFTWKLTIPNLAFDDTTKQSMSLEYTQEEHQAFTSLLATGSISASYLFVSATATANWKSQCAKASKAKTLYMALSELHPVATIFLKDSLVPSPAFKECIDDILKSDDIYNQFNKLLQALDDFGHVFPISVTIGGCYVFESKFRVEEWVESEALDLNASFKIAVAQKITEGNPSGGGGKVEVGFDDQNKGWLNSSSIEKSLDLTIIGGDGQLVDLKQWRNSLVSPLSWRVIEYGAKDDGSYASVLDVLDDDVKNKVEKVWQIGRDLAWNGDKKKQHNELPDSSRFPIPLFWAGRSVKHVAMISRSPKSNFTLLQAKDAANVFSTTRERVIPVQHQPHILWESYPPIEAQHIQQTIVEAPVIGQTEAQYWQNCYPAPKRLDRSAAGNPEECSALWLFEYTGILSADGDPLYWIVSGDGKWLLAGFNDKGNGSFWANLLPAAQRNDLVASQSPAAWVLAPADPTGVQDDRTLSSCFLIWNPVCRGFLGPEVKLNGTGRWNEAEHKETKFEYAGSYGGTVLQFPDAEPTTTTFPSVDKSDSPEVFTRTALSRSIKTGVDKTVDLSAGTGRMADVLEKIYSSPDIVDYCWELNPYPGLTSEAGA